MAVILLVAIAVRAANLAYLADVPILERQAGWVDSDMAVNFEWSSRILDGDLLCRDTIHPYTRWMAEIAPPATWEHWWGGRTVFQQAPLYPYLLAAVRAVAGDRFFALVLAQLALGLASVALVTLLAWRVFDATVATVAGLAAALYAPFAFHETLMLRDTLAVTTSLAMLWMLVRADDEHPRRWFAAGVLFAVALLARETTLLFAPVVVVWIATRHGVERRRALAAWMLGATVGCAPLLARNLVVGAPPFALSTRAVEGFVFGHAADGSPTDLVVPASTARILPAADGHLPRAMALTLATHDGVRAFVTYEIRKVAALLASYEAYDNANFYYFADLSPPLMLLPGFALALGLGLVGLVVAPRSGPGDRLLRWFLVATAAGLMYATVLARYRLVAVAAMLPYTAAALVWSARRVRAGRPWHALGAAAGAALVAWMSIALGTGHARQRPLEYSMTAEVHRAGGDARAALTELGAGLAAACDDGDRRALSGEFPKLAMGMVAIEGRNGFAREVAATLEAVAERCPDDPSVHALLGAVYQDLLGDRERAASHGATAARLARR